MEHYNDFLYHHGVKGMKWGVRKERSSSGSRPSRGERRIARIDKKIAKNEARGAKLKSKKLTDRRRVDIAVNKENARYLKAKRKVAVAKNTYKESGLSKDKTALKRAKTNKQRVAMDINSKRGDRRMQSMYLGWSKSDQGAYMRRRSKGESALKAGLKTQGQASVKNLARHAATQAGRAAVPVVLAAATAYASKKASGGSKALPAANYMNMKKGRRMGSKIKPGTFY